MPVGISYFLERIVWTETFVDIVFQIEEYVGADSSQ